VNPRPRTLAVIAVAVALLVQTWLWIGITDAPIGYTAHIQDSPLTRAQFLLAGMPGALGPAANMTIHAGPYHFEQDWQLSDGGAVHISEDVAAYSILLGGEPSYDKVIAAVHTRANWQETTALGGRVNALRARIGRVSISIEGPLSHDDLFRIAESLRPGFASLLNL
jgi:hypothetical protein